MYGFAPKSAPPCKTAGGKKRAKSAKSAKSKLVSRAGRRLSARGLGE
tara:strand:+ start:740 stop:880 length:141 start_codon:yes stop_codon:yes gene_type:complete